jgi:hypothetical protein
MGDKEHTFHKVNILDVLPTDGEGRDHMIQKLICRNRQTYIPILLDEKSIYSQNSNYLNYYLEFIPNLMDSGLSGEKTYDYDVYITNRETKKKEYLLNMHCAGSSAQDWLSPFGTITFDMARARSSGINNSDDNNRKFKNTTYTFEDGMEIVSKKYFTLDKDDVEYLKSEFPERFVIISIINYLLAQTFSRAYSINAYSRYYFIDITDLKDVEIKKEYRSIINPLLGNDIDLDVFYKIIRIKAVTYDSGNVIGLHQQILQYFNSNLTSGFGIPSSLLNSNEEEQEKITFDFKMDSWIDEDDDDEKHISEITEDEFNEEVVKTNENQFTRNDVIGGIDPASSENSHSVYTIMSRWVERTGNTITTAVQKKPTKPEDNKLFTNTDDIDDFDQNKF